MMEDQDAVNPSNKGRDYLDCVIRELSEQLSADSLRENLSMEDTLNDGLKNK
jgi:hypothetical protein